MDNRETPPSQEHNLAEDALRYALSIFLPATAIYERTTGQGPDHPDVGKILLAAAFDVGINVATFAGLSEPNLQGPTILARTFSIPLLTEIFF